MNNPTPAALEGRKHTARTDATLEAMQGGRYSADNCHPLYVLSAELERSEADLLAQNAEMREALSKIDGEIPEDPRLPLSLIIRDIARAALSRNGGKV